MLGSFLQHLSTYNANTVFVRPGGGGAAVS